MSAPDNDPPGRVYIRSKPKRGHKGKAPLHEEACISTKIVDVTSAQPLANANRRAFSPMHIERGRVYHAPDGEEYACYEHYWQSLKFFPNRPHHVDKAWWRNQIVSRRCLPKVDPATCLYAADETRFPGEVFDYVASRKKFYVADYGAWLDSSQRADERFDEMRYWLRRSWDVIVSDFDGPRDADGQPLIEEVTVDLLRDKIEDVAHPFGHGYVVAAKLLGIPAAAYCQ
jgi:hypothetical protein